LRTHHRLLKLWMILGGWWGFGERERPDTTSNRDHYELTDDADDMDMDMEDYQLLMFLGNVKDQILLQTVISRNVCVKRIVVSFYQQNRCRRLGC
jgi:hypothetical protein